MPLKYKLVQKGNPSRPDEPKKVYAMAVNDMLIDQRRLSDEIAAMSTISPADTYAMIECLIRIIPKHVINGEVVSLGDFGTFSVNLRSQGAESRDAYNLSLINGVKMIFRPGKVVKKALKEVIYQKMSST
jgi:predicted histone-like DNA-binding protein